jgi:lipid-A-disaccharide synthase-like uncharacterized protein
VSVFEVLGVAGIAISMLAYVPQIAHLWREHCSAGVSRRAWAMWLVSSALIATFALYRRDPVFILLQISTLTSAAIILGLAQKYRGLVCAFHAHAPTGEHDAASTTSTARHRNVTERRDLEIRQARLHA